MNLAEYTIKLLSRYKLLEVSKIENPRFNVLDIWKLGDTIYAIVDNIEPLKEVTETRTMLIRTTWMRHLQHRLTQLLTRRSIFSW